MIEILAKDITWQQLKRNKAVIRGKLEKELKNYPVPAPYLLSQINKPSVKRDRSLAEQVKVISSDKLQVTFELLLLLESIEKRYQVYLSYVIQKNLSALFCAKIVLIGLQKMQKKFKELNQKLSHIENANNIQTVSEYGSFTTSIAQFLIAVWVGFGQTLPVYAKVVRHVFSPLVYVFDMVARLAALVGNLIHLNTLEALKERDSFIFKVSVNATVAFLNLVTAILLTATATTPTGWVIGTLAGIVGWVGGPLKQTLDAKDAYLTSQATYHASNSQDLALKEIVATNRQNFLAQLKDTFWSFAAVFGLGLYAATSYGLGGASLVKLSFVLMGSGAIRGIGNFIINQFAPRDEKIVNLTLNENPVEESLKPSDHMMLPGHIKMYCYFSQVSKFPDTRDQLNPPFEVKVEQTFHSSDKLISTEDSEHHFSLRM